MLDLADASLTKWISRVLLEDLALRVDAIYTFNSSQCKPSTLLLDVTQIVNDFRLFSQF